MEITSGKLNSEFVREHWRDVVDYVVAGNHVVVSRNSKPAVAIIHVEDFRALMDELEDLRDLRLAQKSLVADAAAGDPVAIRILQRDAAPTPDVAEDESL